MRTPRRIIWVLVFMIVVGLLYFRNVSMQLEKPNDQISSARESILDVVKRGKQRSGGVRKRKWMANRETIPCQACGKSWQGQTWVLSMNFVWERKTLLLNGHVALRQCVWKRLEKFVIPIRQVKLQVQSQLKILDELNVTLSTINCFTCALERRKQEFCAQGIQFAVYEIRIPRKHLPMKSGKFLVESIVDEIGPRWGPSQDFPHSCIWEGSKNSTLDPIPLSEPVSSMVTWFNGKLAAPPEKNEGDALQMEPVKLCLLVYSNITINHLENWLQYYREQLQSVKFRIYDARDAHERPDLKTLRGDNITIVGGRRLGYHMRMEDFDHLQSLWLSDCYLDGSLSKHRWVGMLDVDEFIAVNFTLYSNLRDLLNQEEAKCYGVSFGPVHFVKEVCDHPMDPEKHTLEELRSTLQYHLDEDPELWKLDVIERAKIGKTGEADRMFGVGRGPRFRRKWILNPKKVKRMVNIHEMKMDKRCSLTLDKARIDHYRGYGSSTTLDTICKMRPQDIEYPLTWTSPIADCEPAANVNKWHLFCKLLTKSYTVVTNRLYNNFVGV